MYYLVVCLLPTLFAFLGSQSGLEGTLVPSIRGKLKENVGSRWKSCQKWFIARMVYVATILEIETRMWTVLVITPGHVAI